MAIFQGDGKFPDGFNLNGSGMNDIIIYFSV